MNTTDIDRKKFLQSVAGSSFGLLLGLSSIKAERAREDLRRNENPGKTNDLYVSNKVPLQSQPYIGIFRRRDGCVSSSKGSNRVNRASRGEI